MVIIWRYYMEKYVIMLKVYDRRYDDFYRIEYRLCEGYRELRDIIIRHDLNPSEYIIFKETDIKIKKVSGKAR